MNFPPLKIKHLFPSTGNLKSLNLHSNILHYNIINPSPNINPLNLPNVKYFNVTSNAAPKFYPQGTQSLAPNNGYNPSQNNTQDAPLAQPKSPFLQFRHGYNHTFQNIFVSYYEGAGIILKLKSQRGETFLFWSQKNKAHLFATHMQYLKKVPTNQITYTAEVNNATLDLTNPLDLRITTESGVKNYFRNSDIELYSNPEKANLAIKLGFNYASGLNNIGVQATHDGKHDLQIYDALSKKPIAKLYSLGSRGLINLNYNTNNEQFTLDYNGRIYAESKLEIPEILPSIPHKMQKFLSTALYGVNFHTPRGKDINLTIPDAEVQYKLKHSDKDPDCNNHNSLRVDLSTNETTINDQSLFQRLLLNKHLMQNKQFLSNNKSPLSLSKHLLSSTNYYLSSALLLNTAVKLDIQNNSLDIENSRLTYKIPNLKEPKPEFGVKNNFINLTAPMTNILKGANLSASPFNQRQGYFSDYLSKQSEQLKTTAAKFNPSTTGANLKLYQQLSQAMIQHSETGHISP